jgi:hypothetical protein
MSSRLAHRLSLFFAFGIIVLLAYSLKGMAPMTACGDLAKGYQPILAFELARSVADLQTIFGSGASACRAAAQTGFAQVNFSDNFIFIPIYSSFLIFFFIGTRARDPFLSNIAIVIAVIVALGDWVENHNLVRLAAAPDAPPVDALFHLHVATSVKWIGLGIINFIGGIILGQRGGLANNLAFVLCAASLILTGLGLSYSPSFGPHISNAIVVGWIIFLIVDIREAFRSTGKSD